jgi:predicted flap endonuclease-1-like 5' DNA nuclease/archaellum component FlaC
MQYLQINLLDIPVCDISWWHWLLAMLVPFLLGYLLRYFLNGKYKTQLGALEADKASLEADLKKAKSMKVAAPVIAGVDKTELNALKDKVRDLEAHNSKLKVDIGDALAVKQQFAGINIDAMKKRIAELEGIEARLSGDVESHKALSASLTANTGDLDALRAKLSGAQAELGNMNAQVNALKAELAGITRENDNISGLRNDVRDLSGKVGALTVENERLKSQATSATANTADLDAAKAALAAAESSSAAHKAKIAELEAANSALQASATNAAASGDAAAKAAAEAADAKAKLSEASIEASNLRLRLEQLTAESGGMKSQAESLTAENESLKAKLAAAQAAHEADKISFAAAAPVAAPAAPVVPDDLKIIEGIGPKIEELYNAAGIFTFKQLIATPVERLKQILVDAGPRFQMHDPGTWAEQAQLADEGKMDELKVLQDKLNAGKE